jgi:predicted nucleotide-binding protein
MRFWLHPFYTDHLTPTQVDAPQRRYTCAIAGHGATAGQQPDDTTNEQYAFESRGKAAAAGNSPNACSLGSTGTRRGLKRRRCHNVVVHYHVYVFELYDTRARRGQPFYFLNLSEEDLRDRIVRSWDRGTPMTWDGRTAESTKGESINVFRTADPLVIPEGANAYTLMSEGDDVTNEWITGPAGSANTDASAVGGTTTQRESPLRDHRRVMVVHGRNARARDAMFMFLRALGLEPLEWDRAVAETGTGSPHNLDAVRAAMEIAQAVVVLLTPEDQAGLLPAFADERDDDVLLRGQPRQNVILEAGLAMGIDGSRVILVELGRIRRPSDFDGLNAVRLTNAAASRLSLRTRLQTAGCAVSEAGSDWTRSETGGDFEAAVVTVEPHPPA